ncbi:THUMP domain-containing protein [archaeon]|nr:THUMP domain-containing protein [archaeon]
MEANLIVTYNPTHAQKAEQEIKELAEQFSDVKFLESGFEGVAMLHTAQNPKVVVKQISEIFSEEPYKFKYTFRWIPIETWCNSTMTDMSNVVKSMDAKIDQSESWKIDIGKRGFEGNTMDIVMSLTEHINKPKVDLKNPQNIVKVEIVGDRAGLSLLKPDEYLNIASSRKV